jgi:hypothetical protein
MWGTCDVCGEKSKYLVIGSKLEACGECVSLARSIAEPDMRRDCYADKTFTLDGRPARVIGYENEFATVASSEASFEWSWSAVARIVSKGGRFTS